MSSPTLDTGKVVGSIPITPTNKTAKNPVFFPLFQRIASEVPGSLFCQNYPKIANSTRALCGKIAVLAIALSATGCPPIRPEPGPTPGPEPTGIPTATPTLVPIQSRIFGVTIDDVSNLPAIVDALKKLPRRIVVRIVFDADQGPADYRQAVEAIAPVADILGQPADSTYVKALSLDAYRKRFQEYVAAFPQIQSWEIGNEVNGDWLGSGVPAKLDAALDVVKGAGRKAVLVPYWNTASCADGNGPYLPWIERNVSAKVKAGADRVLVSIYGEDCDGPEPTVESLKADMAKLGAMFPNAELGIGEYGSAKAASKEGVLRYYLTLPQLHARDVFFGGYWYFKQDMVPAGTRLWGVFSDGIK